MDNSTIWKISLAGLMHDIGKVLQGCTPKHIQIPADYENRNAGLFLPQKGGNYTHKHALYTAFFIENFHQFLPKELNAPNWGEEESFIRLAAKHHAPETPAEHIVSEADSLSSGYDRIELTEGEEIPIRQVYSTRLVPVFEYLLTEDSESLKKKIFEWAYPLAPLSARSIFPKKVAKEEPKEAYEKLCEGFFNGLKKLCHKKSVKLWIRNFDSLYRIYTSHIPAARVGKTIKDVSLYDHSRATAALAAALYLYHRETETFDIDSIRNREEQKFLLVSGDFYGIQSFIFRTGGDERHHRAKLLRGRSFMVSLLTDLAAEFICEKLGLTFLSVAFSAAGKFHIIAPNTESVRGKLEEARREISRWFYENFYGESGIGIATTPARPFDFVGGEFINLWTNHLKSLEEAKFHRIDIGEFGGKIEGYLDSFRNDIDPPVCPLCSKSPSSPEVKEKYTSCKICRDHIFVGTNLVRGKRLAVTKGEGELLQPLFNGYQLKFLNGCASELAEKGALVKLIDFNVRDDGSCPEEVEFVPLNGYVPVYSEEDLDDERLLAGEASEKKKLELIDLTREGMPKTFHHIAKTALKIENGKCFGVEMLATLKADVDDLGVIFSCGIPERFFTLSRLATLSRQLNNFFTLYLPYALKKERGGRFKNTYTVFAGGDDLFLIGPWNSTIELALFLKKQFERYVCCNPKVHFSAGISFHKSHTPVDRIAEEAEAALNAAKSADKAKNKICIFSRVLTWREYETFFGSITEEIERHPCVKKQSPQENSKSIIEQIESWYREGILTRSMLYKTCEICRMAEEARVYFKNKEIPISKLQCAKWPAYLRYYLVRNIKDEKLYQEVAEKLCQWTEEHDGKLLIPLWKLLYETRKQKL